ncbi:metallophosphoesterase family protein [Jiangella muralis]|uniref:metallophosphoesterase family protein n=1 Tax=Jiangella muralis TaxID=702383 RepID=UPI003B846475
MERRTIELMEKVLDSEQPDLVVHNGDNITGGCANATEMRQAMNNVVQPMEQRQIPWVVTYGNHDEDSTPDTGMDEEDMLAFYRSYGHNLNQPSPRGVTGSGTMNLLIRGARGQRPVFNLFLLDSGRYAPSTIAGQDFAGYPTWDWLRMNQVHWYTETSELVEKRAGQKVPALMFIHIPLWEYRFMWFASVDSRTAADHERAVAKHGIIGERNEDECPGPFNCGMFSAILDRGDVRGVFCGHDHVNTYVGDYYGVLLGAGDVDIETHLVFAGDLGIDLTANDQSIDPLPLPDGRRRK